MNSTLQPVIISIFRRGYDRHRFIGDLASGITVGFVALPLAIAFAIASGVKPEQGLYTAVIAGFTIALLGGSSVQVSGPTGAFVVVVYSIVQRYGYDGLAVATLLAGLMLCLMGLLRMGTVLRFIPYPLTVGFTSGIALIIFSSQIKDFLGLETGELPANFVEKWAVIGASLGATSPSALAIGTLSLLILIAWPRITHRVPGSLVAIVIATLAVPALDLEVATIGSRYGVVPNTLPEPRLPSISWSLIVELFSPAFTIALLGAIESLLSAVVADGMTGERHKSNAELFAQGIGNILSPLFSGIPATGAIARTATNIKSGGRTPVAAVIHAVTLLTIMYLFAPWAALIPLPALAAILIIVAYHMSERRSFAKMFRGPRSDLAVMMATFLLTVLIDLTVAIEVGVVLAALLFMRRMAHISQARFATGEIGLLSDDDEQAPANPRPISAREVPKGVEVFEVYGALFFAAVESFKQAIEQVKDKPKVLIVRMRFVVVLDASGLKVLEELLERTTKQGTVLLFSGLQEQPRKVLKSAGFLERLGKGRVFNDIDSALEHAREILKGLE